MASTTANEEEATKPSGPKRNYEDDANWFSYILMTHLSELFALGSARPLEADDLGGISEQDKTDALYQRFMVHFEEEKKKPLKERGLWSVLWKTVGHWKLILALFLFGLYAALLFGPVLILSRLVKCFAGYYYLTDAEIWVLVALLFVFPMVGSIALAHSNTILAHIGAQVRNTLISVIYRKAMVISPSRRQAISSGRIITMFSDDTNQIRMFLFFVNNSILAPFQIGATLYLIYQQVNVATFVGLGYQVLTIPITGIVFGLVAKVRAEKMKFTDKRVKLLNEVLNGIRIIKYYAWEAAFVKKTEEIRANEVRLLEKMGYLFNVTFGFLLLGAPQIQTVLIFYTFTALGNQLDASRAFTTMALFGLMTTPFIFLPYGLQQYNQSLVSTRRIMEFLCEEELVPYVQNGKPGDEDCIHFQNTDMSWLTDEELAALEASKAAAEKAKAAADAAKAGAGKGKGYKALPQREHEPSPPQIELVKVAPAVEKTEQHHGVNRAIHTLTNLNFRVKKGQLVGIVGSVGSGKSSILNAILGEMHLRSGSITVTPGCSNIAYCDQRPWIVNASVRDNILFGKEYNEERFNRAVFASAMIDDMKILQAGEQTEIGERGINLSGGQKARVALARAVYSDADTYLLDDPLSAVDAHVGEHIFTQCILGALAGKTRVLVTHHTHVLPRCDMVVILNNDGSVLAMGTFAEILASGVDISAHVVTATSPEIDPAAADADVETRIRRASSAARTGSNTSGKESEEEKKSTSPVVSSDSAKDDKKRSDGKVLMSVEERATGSVSLKTYGTYIAFGGAWLFLITILLQLGCQVINIESSFWLSDWGKATIEENYVHFRDMSKKRNLWWLHGYAALQMSSVACLGFSRIFLTAHRTNASRMVHNSLLRKVLFFPVSFFDVTPIGRVINRFSQDIASIDEDLAQSMSQVIGMGGGVLGGLGGIIGSTKGTFLILVFPLAYLYYKFQSYFRKSNTAIARIEAISRSPIYADFSQTLSGTTTIRAYNQQARFISKLEVLANANTVPGVLQQIVGQWLGIRLDFLGSLVLLFVGALAAGLRNTSFIPPGYLGLGLSYAIQLTSLLKMTVRAVSTLEAQFNSVDRVSHYCYNIPVEEPESPPSTSQPAADSDAAVIPERALVVPPENWPSEGVVEFQNVTMGYREGDLVLKDVSFRVAGKEKIGIAGRTGCGKSTLMVVLFRIEKLRGGRILIDGLDIAGMPLHSLRSKLCIIPQDPVMFSATVRFNIDPFEEFTDEQVWNVLRDVNMEDHVNSLPNKLNELVAEGGDNFSAGQRQLVCIARAILRKPKILVMDEATASIDQATDNFIQEMIRVKFKECTVLTIAHRLDTIIDSSKVLVMDAGFVAEFDTPKTLLGKPNGDFKGLWERHKAADGSKQQH